MVKRGALHESLLMLAITLLSLGDVHPGRAASAPGETQAPVARALLATVRRVQIVVQMAYILSDELPLLMLYWDYTVTAFSSRVSGFDPNAIDTLVSWNIHEWQLR
jgi:hypothetical protein